MADNLVANPGAGGATFSTDDIGGVQWPFTKLAWGPRDTANEVDDASGKRLPVKVAETVGLTDTQLRASAVPVSGSGVFHVDDNASSLTVDGTVAVSTVTTITNVVHVDDNASTLSVDDGGDSITVDGTVAVSGSVAVTGPLTDAQLRATPVPVSGTVTITDGSGPVTVDGTVSVTQPVAVTDNAGSLTVDTPQLAATLGQKTMANSAAVVIASDQSAVPASQSGTWNIGTVTTVTGITNVVHVDDNAGSLTVDGTVAISGSVAVTGPLTDAQLRATPVPVSGTVTITDGSGPVTVDGTITANQGGAPWTVTGTKTNNNAAPGATNVGTLPALANASAPTWTEGNQVALSTDLSGALRVSGSFSGGGDGAIVDGVSSGIRATVYDYTNSNPLAVTLTDTTGNYVVAGGGIQYVEDTASAGAETMSLVGAIRQDNKAAVTTTDDGDYSNLKTDRVGQLRITNGEEVAVRNLLENIDINIGTLNANLTGLPIANTYSQNNPLPVSIQSSPIGGHNTFELVSAASTNATTVKHTTGCLYGWAIYNTNVAARYVKFYDAIVPSVGTKPKLSLLIPGASAGAGNNFVTDAGIPYTNGISFVTVTGTADSDTTAVAANDLIINLLYT